MYTDGAHSDSKAQAPRHQHTYIDTNQPQSVTVTVQLLVCNLFELKYIHMYTLQCTSAHIYTHTRTVCTVSITDIPVCHLQVCILHVCVRMTLWMCLYAHIKCTLLAEKYK